MNHKRIAEISDDTQMTLFTATGMLVGITRGGLRGIMAPWQSYIWKSYTNWCEMQMGLSPEDEQRFSWLTDVPEMRENRAPGTTCVHYQSGCICTDVIDEIVVDLCHGCIMSEYSTYRDPEWEAKYIHMNREL